MLTLFNTSSDPNEDYLKIDRTSIKRKLTNQHFRMRLRDVSIYEDEQDIHYATLLNLVADHNVGSVPLITSLNEDEDSADDVEDKFLEWSIKNEIGLSLRMLRRCACKTGVCIGIPYIKENPKGPIGLAIRDISPERLVTPMDAKPSDRIIDGIQYDKNWEPVAIFIKTEDVLKPQEYKVKDIIFWKKKVIEDQYFPIPECAQALCIFPSIRRFFTAVVKGEEFKASIPMATVLDPQIYKPDDASNIPIGSFQYEPNMVPTLPPGVKLEGLNVGSHSADRADYTRLVISAAGRIKKCPANLLMGDSGNLNMSASQVDLQPWQDEVERDRVDFKPIVEQVIGWWQERAAGTLGYLPIRAKKNLAYALGYTTTFQHNDPKKRADARSTDLASGSTTLVEIWGQKGGNVRRALKQEAKNFGISVQELKALLLQSRFSSIGNQLNDSGQPQDNQSDGTQK